MYSSALSSNEEIETCIINDGIDALIDNYIDIGDEFKIIELEEISFMNRQTASTECNPIKIR